ncbi:hypothetical protein RRG08_004884 [Elysia crispata]|uniref:Uncharacterized protein n=1 Tax=Elysia crispata TaxID=231223 RepID=A0AAE0ZJI9_9GAST|nr:hypothetical protein RRG08_004884 [Elysia crispata]
MAREYSTRPNYSFRLHSSRPDGGVTATRSLSVQEHKGRALQVVLVGRLDQALNGGWRCSNADTMDITEAQGE